MMLNTEDIVPDNMVVEGYEEVDDIQHMNSQHDLQFEEDDMRCIDSDGYGGMSLESYNEIVEFKKTGTVPVNVDRRFDRSAPSHWRARCNRFTLADDNETLLYYNPSSPVNDQPKVVVKKGEVRKVLERIHELIGHLGQKRTQMVVLRKLYWRSVRQDVKNYINQCDFCNQKKIEGRKIIKAPVDITSENFDISVAVRLGSNCDRLEFTLVGYNEEEVRQAAMTRMTSYTFKETSNEFRTRYTIRDSPMPTFRRQPYVKRNGQMAIGYLLPFQQRRQMEPEFIEIYERQNMGYTDGDAVIGEEYEQVVEMVDPMAMPDKRDEQSDAQPVTLDGQMLQGKKYFKEEVEEEVDVGDPTQKLDVKKQKDAEDIQQMQPSEGIDEHAELNEPSSSAHKTSMERATTLRMTTRFASKRNSNITHTIYDQDEASRRQVDLKKRRRELPGIHGMAGRFTMAVAENENISQRVNEVNQQILAPFDATSTRPELAGLPPICLMPSLDPQVAHMQKELIQRQLRIQKMQEKVLRAQYDATMRIPMTRYTRAEDEEEDHVQEEAIEVEHEHELNVMDEHDLNFMAPHEEKLS